MKPNTTGYRLVNGLNMYYEIHGEGRPLVLIHGGGSTIYTCFAKVLPLFSQNRQVIAIELQAHGHTADRDTPTSFEQDADDVASLLDQLDIKSADIFGWSNGGNTAMQVAIRHPAVVWKLIIGSAFYQREGFIPQFWDFMANASLDNMPQPLKDAYLNINPDQSALEAMHNRDRDRMLNFKDWSDDTIRSIKAPTLLINGDQDVILPEHTFKMYRLLPNARLMIYPGIHGDFIGELCVGNGMMPVEASVKVMEGFLDEG